MKHILAILAVISLVPTSIFAAEGDIYNCQFKVGPGSMISERVMIGMEHASGRVFVADGFIIGIIGEPIEGKVVSNDAKKIAFRWSLRVPDPHGTIARLSYRLAYFKGNGKSIVSVQAMGYMNSDNARGKCTVKQGDV
jgi:hypothetical protein